MTIEVLFVLFCALEVLTPITTQALKTTLDGIGIKYNSTVLALIVAVALSILVVIAYAIANSTGFSALIIFQMIALMFLNWLGSTLGYDTVKKALSSIKAIDKE